MSFYNFKLKIFFIALILLFFYLLFKLLNLFCVFKAEKEIARTLEKKYTLVKKNQKLLQENYWNIKYCNNLLVD